jgi:membrane protease YdiL (CAAX protease family)
LTDQTKSGGWQDCLAGRHSISLDLFLILPLLIVYEIGINLSESNFRNAAEVILKDFYLVMGPQSARFFHWFLAAVIVLCFLRRARGERSFFPVFLTVVLEALLLALILGPLLSGMLGGLFLQYQLTSGSAPGFSSSILLSIGAGVYEEIVFRFLILGGLFAVCRFVFRTPFWVAALISLGVSSVLFSLYHHIGPYAQPITTPVFVFRTAAGAILGLAFIFRGFGVAVYVHAFYDILKDIETVLREGS